MWIRPEGTTLERRNDIDVLIRAGCDRWCALSIPSSPTGLHAFSSAAIRGPDAWLRMLPLARLSNRWQPSSST